MTSPGEVTKPCQEHQRAMICFLGKTLGLRHYRVLHKNQSIAPDAPTMMASLPGVFITLGLALLGFSTALSKVHQEPCTNQINPPSTPCPIHLQSNLSVIH